MSNLIFFFNDTATTEIYTLSLHDALPISQGGNATGSAVGVGRNQSELRMHLEEARTALQNDNTEDALIHLDLALNVDRKSTRLNSSHANISYAVFCLKKKKISPPHRSIPC